MSLFSVAHYWYVACDPQLLGDLMARFIAVAVTVLVAMSIGRAQDAPTMPEAFIMDTYPTYENTDSGHHFRFTKHLDFAKLFHLLER